MVAESSTPSDADTPSAEQLAALLAAARAGSVEALGRLLEACRPFLLFLAREALGSDLQAKVGPSDLVQDTFLEAQRDFAGFVGLTRDELRGWLRRILEHNAANVRRHYRETDRRNVAREVGLPDEAGSAPQAPPLAAPDPSPSSAAAADEESARLHAALTRLPEDHREVIRWRNYERLSFEEIGERMGRSADAARKLWGRAVEELGHELKPDDGS